MKIKLKPLNQQVIVITGATSGIGLAIARKAAKKGARLVLAARNDEALRSLEEEITAHGGQAVTVISDVGIQPEVRRISDVAIERFGGFDTWINNAGISIYGACDEVSLEDHRRLFDTNYWGVVHGSLVATRHLRRNGGALINIGSILSDRALPTQGAYAASKHAVKGFTDTLRMEIELAGAPVSVTLVKPSTINTPHKDHAKNYLPVQALNPPPVYSADLVADAVLHAAEHPVRDIVIGGGGKLLSVVSQLAPRFTDRILGASMARLQRKGQPTTEQARNSLYGPGEDGREHSVYPGRVFERSVYNLMARRPAMTAAVVMGAGYLAWSLLSGHRRGR